MTNEGILKVVCPECHSVNDVHPSAHNFDCNSCGYSMSILGHLCPHCSTYHKREDVICDHCGSPMTRICPNCRTTNWSGNEICISCGRSLGVFDQIRGHHNLGTVDRLNEQMSEARMIKEVEELASDRRMAELMAIEKERQAAIRERMADQKKQERQLLILVFSAVALFLLILAIYAVISVVA